MDENKKQKLLNIARIADKGMVGLLEHIADLEIKIEETSKLADKLDEIKAKSDNKIINSVNLTEEDKKDISNIVRGLVKSEEIAELIHDSVADTIKQSVENNIFDRLDSKLDREGIVKAIKSEIPKVKDGKTPTTSELTSLIKPLIPKISAKKISSEVYNILSDELQGAVPKKEDIEKGIADELVKNLPQFGEKFRDGLELLKEDDRLSVESLKGWEKTEEGILNRAVSIVDNRTSFLINKVSNLSEKVNNIVDEKAIWGEITGTLSNQTDLQTALNLKLDKTADLVTDDTTNRDLVLTDSSKYIRMTSADAKTIAVPPQSDVAWATGTVITIRNAGAGALTFVEGSGVAISPDDLELDENDTTQLVRVSEDVWDVI